jgi:hypothetical protein
MKTESILILILIMTVNLFAREIPDKFNESYKSSLKLSGMYQGLHDQVIINPSYTRIINNHEVIFGAYYATVKYDDLVHWKTAPAKVKMYGIKFGYINKPQLEKRIAIRTEADILLASISTDLIYKSKEYRAAPVVAFAFLYGPNLKYSISPKIDLSFSFQLLVGYGTNSNFEIFDAYPYRSEFALDIETLFSVNYKLF